MANFTRKELEQLQHNKPLQMFISSLGFDFDDIISDIKKELEREEIKSRINEVTNKSQKECFDKKPIETTTNVKEKYESPKIEKSFIMNYTQFDKFIKDYSELLNAVKKIDYWYGIRFDTSSTGFSLEGKAREIIWDLIGIIFGEDNREDIADYLYGNSNFDSPKSLYEELT